jgi:hypothetical protein
LLELGGDKLTARIDMKFSDIGQGKVTRRLVEGAKLLNGFDAGSGGDAVHANKDLVAGVGVDQIHVVGKVGRGGEAETRWILDQVDKPDLTRRRRLAHGFLASICRADGRNLAVETGAGWLELNLDVLVEVRLVGSKEGFHGGMTQAAVH